MVRKSILVVAVIFLLSSNALAGLGSLYSSQYSHEQGTVIGAVEIEGKGIYNLIVSAYFLRRPQDKKVFKSDAYEKFIDRLMVEWRGVALQKVLEAKTLKISDLASLKKVIETDLEKLATELKNKLLPGQDVEVVYSISNFFLLEPIDK